MRIKIKSVKSLNEEYGSKFFSRSYIPELSNAGHATGSNTSRAPRLRSRSVPTANDLTISSTTTRLENKKKCVYPGCKELHSGCCDSKLEKHALVKVPELFQGTSVLINGVRYERAIPKRNEIPKKGAIPKKRKYKKRSKSRFKINEFDESFQTRIKNFKIKNEKKSSKNAPVLESKRNHPIKIESDSDNIGQYSDNIGQYSDNILGEEEYNYGYDDEERNYSYDNAEKNAIDMKYLRSDGKRWKCVYPGCRVAFRNRGFRSLVITHIKSHTRNFCCPVPSCDVVFDNKNDLKSHRKKSHGNNDFTDRRRKRFSIRLSENADFSGFVKTENGNFDDVKTENYGLNNMQSENYGFDDLKTEMFNCGNVKTENDYLEVNGISENDSFGNVEMENGNLGNVKLENGYFDSGRYNVKTANHSFGMEKAYNFGKVKTENTGLKEQSTGEKKVLEKFSVTFVKKDGSLWKCAYPKCIKKYSNKARCKVIRHLKIHIPKKPQIFSKIQRVHSEKPQSLPEKYRKYSRKPQSVRLENKSKKKSFTCKDLKCNFEATSLWNLQKHLTVTRHSPVLKCHHCTYTCRRRGHMQVHIALHSNKNCRKCPFCDFHTLSKHGLERHKGKRHVK